MRRCYRALRPTGSAGQPTARDAFTGRANCPRGTRRHLTTCRPACSGDWGSAVREFGDALPHCSEVACEEPVAAAVASVALDLRQLAEAGGAVEARGVVHPRR